MDFSVRAYNGVKRMGINTVEDFTLYSYKDLMGARNLGPSAVKEIRVKLSTLGVILREE